MPDVCCAFGCSNRRSTQNEGLSFYRIPTMETERKSELRLRWIAAIRREKWSETAIKSARICSAHFVTGKKSNDSLHVDYVPSVFLFHKIAERRSKASVERYRRCLQRGSNKQKNNVTNYNTKKPVNVNNCENVLSESSSSELTFDCQEPNEKSTQTETESHCSKLKCIVSKQKIIISLLKKKLKKNRIESFKSKKNVKILRSKLLDYKNIKFEKKLNFLTGLPKFELFDWILSFMKDQTVNQVVKSLSFENHLLLTLMKIRLGVTNYDLSIRFHITKKNVSLTIRKWLPKLSEVLKNLIVWPSKDLLRANLPKCFKNCCCIIDCTEIFIARPLNLTARAQTYSTYKSHNTIKYLIAMAPAGTVSFLSAGWGGRVSDKKITLKSGFLDKIIHGDCVLADRGFLIEEELATKGAVLRIPSFTRGKSQLSARDVDISRQISHARIHVERVIGRLKTFKILSTNIPISQVDLLDHIMVIISGIINLNTSIMKM
ncbi:uncharacterized protein LOC124809319 [Hydra vulgaris]|uniref:uncharacterized protein LOC124809319 n=1 Tax=Hydra vulgaris TaxID=6087 RepID=UPI0032E9C88A